MSVWDDVFDQYDTTGNTDRSWNNPAVQRAWAAWDAQQRQGANNIYNDANDAVANQYLQSQGEEDQYNNSLKADGKYRIEQDKSGENKGWWYDPETDNSYYYVGNEMYTNPNMLEKADGINMDNFYRDLTASQAAFGKNFDTAGKTNYDYYTLGKGVNLEDIAKPQDYNSALQTGSSGINKYHAKGIDDLNFRISPDVDPFSQQDVEDYNNIITNDDFYGWVKGFSHDKGNTIEDDRPGQEGQRINAHDYFQRDMIDNPMFVDEEIEKGNPSVIVNAVNGSIPDLYKLTNKLAEADIGYFNKDDKNYFDQLSQFMLGTKGDWRYGTLGAALESGKQKDKYNKGMSKQTLEDLKKEKESIENEEYKSKEDYQMASDEQKAIIDENMAKSKDEISNNISTLDNMDQQGLLNDYKEDNEYKQGKSVANANASRLATIALADALGKGNSKYLSKATKEKGYMLQNFLSGVNPFIEKTDENNPTNTKLISNDKLYGSDTLEENDIDKDRAFIDRETGVKVQEKDKTPYSADWNNKIDVPSFLSIAQSTDGSFPEASISATNFLTNMKKDKSTNYLPDEDIINAFKKSGYLINRK